MIAAGLLTCTMGVMVMVDIARRQILSAMRELSAPDVSKRLEEHEKALALMHRLQGHIVTDLERVEGTVKKMSEGGPYR